MKSVEQEQRMRVLGHGAGRLRVLWGAGTCSIPSLHNLPGARNRRLFVQDPVPGSLASTVAEGALGWTSDVCNAHALDC